MAVSGSSVEMDPFADNSEYWRDSCDPDRLIDNRGQTSWSQLCVLNESINLQWAVAQTPKRFGQGKKTKVEQIVEWLLKHSPNGRPGNTKTLPETLKKDGINASEATVKNALRLAYGPVASRKGVADKKG